MFCHRVFHYNSPIFMAALRSRCGHYIFTLWFLLSFYLLFSLPNLSRRQIGCLPYFHTCCGLSANLGCRSEMCCKRLAEIQDAKNRQKFAICAPSRNFVGLYLRNFKTCIDHRKNLLNSSISLTCPHNMVNFGP